MDLKIKSSQRVLDCNVETLENWFYEKEPNWEQGLQEHIQLQRHIWEWISSEPKNNFVSILARIILHRNNLRNPADRSEYIPELLAEVVLLSDSRQSQQEDATAVRP